jgi:hypothetical protein
LAARARMAALHRQRSAEEKASAQAWSPRHAPQQAIRGAMRQLEMEESLQLQPPSPRSPSRPSSARLAPLPGQVVAALPGAIRFSQHEPRTRPHAARPLPRPRRLLSAFALANPGARLPPALAVSDSSRPRAHAATWFDAASGFALGNAGAGFPPALAVSDSSRPPAHAATQSDAAGVDGAAPGQSSAVIVGASCQPVPQPVGSQAAGSPDRTNALCSTASKRHTGAATSRCSQSPSTTCASARAGASSGDWSSAGSGGEAASAGSCSGAGEAASSGGIRSDAGGTRRDSSGTAAASKARAAAAARTWRA